MHEVDNGSVYESDTNLSAERHLALAMRFQAMSDGPLSGLVNFKRYPDIWYEQKTELDELGRTPTDTLENPPRPQPAGEDQPAAKAEAEDSPTEFGLSIEGKDYKLILDNPHQAFLLEMLAAMEPGTTTRCSIALAHGFHPYVTDPTRETAFSQELKAVMQELKLMTGRPLVEATGSRGTTRYSLLEKIDITHRPKSADYKSPTKWDWSVKTRDRTSESSGAFSGRQVEVNHEADESTVNKPAVVVGDEAGFDAKTAKEEPSLTLDPAEESRLLRLDKGLRLELCKMFGFDPDAPLKEELLDDPNKKLPQELREKLRENENLREEVIARHFGLNGYAMMEIEEVSDTLASVIFITPAAVRYKVTDILKKLSPKPGDKSKLDVPGARAYLKFLDSQ